MVRFRHTLLLMLVSLAAFGLARAESVTVAVASNFADTARQLAADYETASGHAVSIVQGSTGKLHAQIVNGAPFDVFLAADVARAEDLESRGVVATDSRFTYAIGRLVLWSPDAALPEDQCNTLLAEPGNGRIAIANPALAPYGLAAQSWLEAAGLWQTLEPRLVYGQNVAQTMQFIATGNAQVGFVALSQLQSRSSPGCMMELSDVDAGLLEQQAVLLERAAANPAAVGFVEYLASAEAQSTILSSGYRLVDDQ